MVSFSPEVFLLYKGIFSTGQVRITSVFLRQLDSAVSLEVWQVGGNYFFQLLNADPFAIYFFFAILFPHPPPILPLEMGKGK